MSIYATVCAFRLPVWLDADEAARHGLVDPATPPARAFAPGEPPGAGRPVREAWVRVWAQAVPPHIDAAGPGWDEWLPPPVPEYVAGVHRDDRGVPRAVFFVLDGTLKATARNGQEYVDPLLVLTGEDYVARPWGRLMEALERLLTRRLT